MVTYQHGREIREQDKIIERIDEFYTELCDSEQNTIIHTNPKEAALLYMKNGTEIGSDHINIETLKVAEYTILKTLA